jgi:hypothetical protein
MGKGYFVSRRATAFEISRSRFRQLKMKWAGFAVQGAELAGRVFFQAQNIGMIQREDLGDSKPPAPISNQG